MQSPPATSYQVIRSLRAGRVLLALLIAFAGVPFVGWFTGMSMNRVCALAFLWCAAVAWVSHYWRTLPQGRLRWDGESWHWSGANEPLAAVTIQYDFQISLWLLMVPAKGRVFGVWMDADPGHMPQWRALRRALVGAGISRRGSEDPMGNGLQALR
jgi:toxin CptA